MTPHERALLQSFVADLSRAAPAGKDPEADGMIRQAVAANPDALYLLVQHALIADQALHAAQAQINALQSQVGAQVAGQTGGQVGGQVPAATPTPGVWVDRSAGLPPAAPPSPAYAPPPPASPLSRSGGLPGFLKTAGLLAGGVVAGDFLADGISNLFSGE